MPVQMKMTDPIREKEWDDRITAVPDYSFFHSSGWAKVLRDSYGFDPVYYTLSADDRLLAVLPMMEVRSGLTGRRGVSLPFTDSCKPCIAAGVSFQNLFDRMTAFGAARGWKYLEFRGGNGFFDRAAASESYYGHRLKLSTDLNRMYSGLKDSVRRNIRKAGNAGVEVGMHRCLSSLEKYFRLHCATRKSKGLPPQPWQFFEKIHDHILSRGLGFVALAFVNGEAVAGAVFFHLGTKAIFKFGASDRRYQDIRANDLVMWEAIRWYGRNGFSDFCFGRTEPENEGLRRFKKGWGSEEYLIRYYRYSLKTRSFIAARGMTLPGVSRLFRIMPMPLLKTAGAVLYRHVA